MTSRSWPLLAVILSITACARTVSVGTAPAPPAPALAYSAPPGQPLTYQLADSSGFTMESGAVGNVQVDIVSSVTANLTFQPESGALRTTIAFTDVTGTFSNSMGNTTSVGPDDAPGPAIVSVDRRGRVTMVDTPELPAAFRQVLGSESVYRKFFIRLPGHAIQRGVAWTDTIDVSENNDSLTTNVRTIVTSVWQRDTIVAGRTLNLIHSDLSNTLNVAGTTQGTEIRQSLTGTSRATTLWDPALNAVVSRTETGTASGQADLPAMGISGITVKAHSQQTLTLTSQPAAGGTGTRG